MPRVGLQHNASGAWPFLASVLLGFYTVLVGHVAWSGSVPVPKTSPSPWPVPSVSSLLKEPIYKRVMEREVMVHAALDDLPSPIASGGPPLKTVSEPEEKFRRYSFYTAMSVNSSLRQTRAILTNYALYAKMIPYVESTVYNEATRVLEIEGGIWKFKLRSFVLFDERGERWIHFRIIGGHFTGLEGDIIFETAGEKSTLVIMRGLQDGIGWPPKLVIEKGAEIVFGFTAQRMRSYVEAEKLKADAAPLNPLGPLGRGLEYPPAPPKTEPPHDGHEVPQPRSHL